MYYTIDKLKKVYVNFYTDLSFLKNGNAQRIIISEIIKYKNIDSSIKPPYIIKDAPLSASNGNINLLTIDKSLNWNIAAIYNIEKKI